MCLKGECSCLLSVEVARSCLVLSRCSYLLDEFCQNHGLFCVNITDQYLFYSRNRKTLEMKRYPIRLMDINRTTDHGNVLTVY